jgi:hypothetical protein
MECMTSTRRRSIFKARRCYLVDCDCLPVEGTSGPLQDQGLLVPPRKAVAGGRLKPNSITEPSVGVRSGPTTVLIGVPRMARARGRLGSVAMPNHSARLAIPPPLGCGVAQAYRL